MRKHKYLIRHVLYGFVLGVFSHTLPDKTNPFDIALNVSVLVIVIALVIREARE